MKITSLNIRHGGGKRINELLNYFSDNPCDVAILCEYRENKNSSEIRKFFTFNGLHHQISNVIDPKLNSVFVASRVPFIVNSGKNQLNFYRRIIDISFPKFDLVAVYFPNKKEKPPVFEELLNLLSLKLNGTICIGDFNTGKHYLDEQSATFIGANYLSKFEEVGLTDAWRYFHGQKKEFSWFSNKGNGFRIDHVFISETLKEQLTNCFYHHDPRENNITDHSAISLELN